MFFGCGTKGCGADRGSGGLEPGAWRGIEIERWGWAWRGVGAGSGAGAGSWGAHSVGMVKGTERVGSGKLFVEVIEVMERFVGVRQPESHNSGE